MAEAEPAAGSLARYQAKRDFEVTPEPAGAVAPSADALSFVVQKHAARRLHWDLRLEAQGVLLSWAVPRGPSLDPGDKRLAVHVEDHPLAYGGFEGSIPEGQYGAGTVMLWDRGTWLPKGDPVAGLAAGKLEFEVRAKRMKGAWKLVRMNKRKGDPDPNDNWLLLKIADRHARPGEGEALVEQHQTSVASRRGMEGIAKAGGTWESRPKGARLAAPPPAEPEALGPDPLPEAMAPQLATLVSRPPAGRDWLHEVKLDGYRLLARLEQGKVRLLTRSGLDWTARFPAIARDLARLPARLALLDGEAVVEGADGRASFAKLRTELESGGGQIAYVAFDLLHRDGHDLRQQPLTSRKEQLADLLGGGVGVVRALGHLDADGEKVLDAACSLRLEGVVSKRREARYVGGRSDAWVKSKCLERQEFIVLGYTLPAGGSAGIGSLALGVREADGLRYAGRVGTGFDQGEGQDLRRRLEPIELATRDAVPVLPADARRGLRRVRPELVVEVAFQTWTDDGRLRHASYQGRREDKPAEEVHAERPVAAATAAATAKPPTGAALLLAGVRLTSPGKALWAEPLTTKADLAAYLEAVAPALLRHAGSRPLSVVRCPEGQGKKCFYQKHGSVGMPPGVATVPVAGDDGPEDYLQVGSVGGLVGLAQMGVLEIHPWGARADDAERPDRLVFDLDPDEGLPFARVVTGAAEIRERLRRLGLQSFLKTTGGKGLHVVVPFARDADWDAAKAFSRALVMGMVAERPAAYTGTLAKKARGGKILIDWLRNGRGATAVAAYSPRARPGAPVAMPVAWEALGPGLDPKRYTVASVPGLLAAEGDAWEGLGRVRQRLGPAIAKLMKR